MTGADIAAAKEALGKRWGLFRPLHNSELGRAVRLSGRDPGRYVQEWINGAKVSGPVSAAIEMMLAGAMPPDPLDTILRQR